MWYRIGAVRNMTGGRKTDPSTKMSEKLKTVRTFKFIFAYCFTNKPLKAKIISLFTFELIHLK
jgi:hypothetical protein